MSMADQFIVTPAKPEGPSPWWLRGGAIFIGVLGFASLINALVMGVGGFLMAAALEGLEPEEICADDESEDCEPLIEELLLLGESPIWSVGAAASALLFLLSIPTAIVMWNAEDRDTALKLAWGWVGIHAASQLYVTHVLVSWSNRFYSEMPSEGLNLGFVSLFNQIASYGGVVMCELTMAAGLAMIAYQTRPPTKVEVPSAFHSKDQ
tara:strand:+ start:5186 stop:5809 length:624 start_codon:yes stop_codon:yes gene_type:complete